MDWTNYKKTLIPRQCNVLGRGGVFWLENDVQENKRNKYTEFQPDTVIPGAMPNVPEISKLVSPSI